MKKALAYIGGPKQLRDFIWLYLYLGKDYEWTLICQPMFPEMKLRDVCEQSGLFKEIIMADPYITRSQWTLAKEAAKMFFYWLVGRSRVYAKKEIAKLVDLDDYELMMIPTSRGVTCGLMILASDCNDIIMTEDGNSDNPDLNERLHLRELFNKDALVKFIFAKMGYFNISCRFPLKSTKKCDRYTEQMDTCPRELFKSVNKLNDMSAINMDEYEQLVDKTFGSISSVQKNDVFVFTSNMEDFSANWTYYNEIIVNYLEKIHKGKKIALKKHPRDCTQYYFRENYVDEINAMVPSELLIPYITNQDIYFFYPSTTVGMALKNKKRINILFLTELGQHNDGGRFDYKQGFYEALSVYPKEEIEEFVNIIKI